MHVRSIGLAIFLAASSGCVSGFPFATTPDDKGSPRKASSAFSAPITADQINAQNAHFKAQDVWDELDREAKSEAMPPEKGSPEKGRKK